MKQKLVRFLASEGGAVTVDWVVLTAALIGLGMLVLTPIAFSTDSSGHKVAESIVDVHVGYGN